MTTVPGVRELSTSTDPTIRFRREYDILSRWEHGESYAEIAQSLAISAGRVGQLAHKARRALGDDYHRDYLLCVSRMQTQRPALNTFNDQLYCSALHVFDIWLYDLAVHRSTLKCGAREDHYNFPMLTNACKLRMLELLQSIAE